MDCYNNQLTSLDVSKNVHLSGSIQGLWLTGAFGLRCSNNLLSSLDISNNESLNQCTYEYQYPRWLDLSNMATLEQVCVWELPFPPNTLIPNAPFCILYVDTTGSPNVYFDTLCSGVGTSKIIKETNHEIQIYPNPTDGILTIDLCNSLNANIEIYNTSGSLIYRKPMKSTQEQIDLSRYTKGLYFVKVWQKGALKVGKVVLE